MNKEKTTEQEELIDLLAVLRKFLLFLRRYWLMVLLLTALGGALGLLLAWLALYVGREWIFTVLDSWPGMVPEGVDVRVSGEMLFAPLVFLAALVLCVVLNLLSALIPAWYSLRKPIVNSLNEKR